MSESRLRLLRSYGLHVLETVNDEPHIDKERLFADAIAYYGWKKKYGDMPHALDLYRREFEAQHGEALKWRSKPVRHACFLRWFIENRFHLMGPLVTEYPDDVYVQKTRFSSPSFRLPTGDPAETFLTQWIAWYLNNAPEPGALCNEARQAEMLAEDIERAHILSLEDREELVRHGERFFAWSWRAIRTPENIIALIVAFLRSADGRAIAEQEYLLQDAGLVRWFCRHDLDQVLSAVDDPAQFLEYLVEIEQVPPGPDNPDQVA